MTAFGIARNRPFRTIAECTTVRMIYKTNEPLSCHKKESGSFFCILTLLFFRLSFLFRLTVVFKVLCAQTLYERVVSVDLSLGIAYIHVGTLLEELR